MANFSCISGMCSIYCGDRVFLTRTGGSMSTEGRFGHCQFYPLRCQIFNVRLLINLFMCIMLCVGLQTEAAAVRPPLKPLNSEKFLEMIAEADVIAIGTVTKVKQSKTVRQPLETVVTNVTIALQRIIKGNGRMKYIEIEETYQQFFTDDKKGDPIRGKDIKAEKTGPVPPVGRYREKTRVFVFLKPIAGSNQYHPVGSGSQDAYLGLFQITSEGVESDRYRFDKYISGYAKSEADFTDFIVSLMRTYK